MQLFKIQTSMMLMEPSAYSGFAVRLFHLLLIELNLQY